MLKPIGMVAYGALACRSGSEAWLSASQVLGTIKLVRVSSLVPQALTLWSMPYTQVIKIRQKLIEQ